MKLEKDTVFEESIEVKGRIYGDYSLTVKGDIDAGVIDALNIHAADIHAWDINALNIDAWDINAWDINAGDINARDIHARNISAWDISAGVIDANGNLSASFVVCEKISVKLKSTFKNILINRSKYEKKERALPKD